MNYYFSKVPEEYQEEGLTPGFNQKYYFRFRVVLSEHEIKFEDNCSRMVPISFIDLKKMKKTINKIIKDLKENYVS